MSAGGSNAMEALSDFEKEDAPGYNFTDGFPARRFYLLGYDRKEPKWFVDTWAGFAKS